MNFLEAREQIDIFLPQLAEQVDHFFSSIQCFSFAFQEKRIGLSLIKWSSADNSLVQFLYSEQLFFSLSNFLLASF